jgi:hypothetical protein
MLEFLYQALECKIGLVLESNDPVTLRSRLYKARKDSGDPRLQDLVISTSRADPATELWIIRRA